MTKPFIRFVLLVRLTSSGVIGDRAVSFHSLIQVTEIRRTADGFNLFVGKSWDCAMS